MNNRVLAFDVYGTLIDTSGVYAQLKRIFPRHASTMVDMWRSKQLEYSFRQTAMGLYRGFSFCTRAALDYVLQYHRLAATAEQKNELLQSYNKLPAFADAKPALAELKAAHSVYAFSNGEAKNLDALLTLNQLTAYFDDIVSVERTRHFKPSPQVYAWFNEATATRKEDTFMVSSNPFDIIGAAHFGFQTIWLQRSQQTVFDPWDIAPHHSVTSLAEIAPLLRQT